MSSPLLLPRMVNDYLHLPLDVEVGVSLIVLIWQVLGHFFGDPFSFLHFFVFFVVSFFLLGACFSIQGIWRVAINLCVAR